MIFTVDFPFGNAETTFLTEEINVLSRHFEKIYLVPFNESGTNSILLPQNVEICRGLTKNLNRFSRGISDYGLVGTLFVKEILRSKNFGLIKNARYHISELLVYLNLAKSLNLYFERNNMAELPSLFYTYWFDAWTSALAIFKIKYNKKFKLITRAHGFDLYEERNVKGYIFPRQLQLKSVDKIFPISKDGGNYLKSKYPDITDKIMFSRLGINQKDTTGLEKSDNNEIILVSCSSIVPVKRVHKIVEILAFSTKSIKWIHFGDGVLMESIMELQVSLPANVAVDMRGNLENSEITRFYSENYVDWFINVSESEGIPVSIMEAISFGIPVVATNVGGVKEIVTPVTGILVDKDFDPRQVVSLIENSKFSEHDRQLVVEFGRSNYDSEKNFTEFSKKLLLTVSEDKH